MLDRHISYFPGETPLYEGGIELRPETDQDRSKSLIRVITDDPSKTFILESAGKHTLNGVPFREDYVGYFVRQIGLVRFSVDLETTPDIDKETIARAILASDWADEQTVA